MTVHLHFADRMVAYETFVNDIAQRLMQCLKEAETQPEYISQAQAFRKYGRKNVERWRRLGRISPIIRPGKYLYSTAQLREVALNPQDYLYR
jgi:hypothetical protein